MPGSAIAGKHNVVIWVGCRQMFQKDIHTNCIAIRHDQKAGISRQRFYRAVHISVFPDMVTRYRWTNSLSAPAVFGLVDASKPCFVLKHQPNSMILSISVDIIFQFADSFVNFLRRQPPRDLQTLDACFWATASTSHDGVTHSRFVRDLFRDLLFHHRPP